MTSLASVQPNPHDNSIPSPKSSLGRVRALGDGLRMYKWSPVPYSGVLVRITEHFLESGFHRHSCIWHGAKPVYVQANKPVYVVVTKVEQNVDSSGKPVSADIWGLDPIDDAETLSEGPESLQVKQRLMVTDASFAKERGLGAEKGWEMRVPIRTIELLVRDYFRYLNGPKEINGMSLDKRFPVPSLACCLEVCEPNSIHRFFLMSDYRDANPNYVEALNAFLDSEAEKVDRQLNNLPEPKQLNYPIRNEKDQEACDSGQAKVVFQPRTKEQLAVSVAKKSKRFDRAMRDMSAIEFDSWAIQRNKESAQRQAIIKHVENRRKSAEKTVETSENTQEVREQKT